MSDIKKRIAVIGAGPSGMSVLYQFDKLSPGNDVEIVCFEKQATWGGMWNFTWRTGTDEFGEPCHNGMYKHHWANNPKECLEYHDYTFLEHFGKAVPSYPPRQINRDYLEERMKKSKSDLKQLVRFNTIVKFVQHDATKNKFTVSSTNLVQNQTVTELFDYVIVAVGIFNVPNSPTFPGMEMFEGRILHSHNFRDAKEFKGQRLLAIGSKYSAEDVALQCVKFGAKHAICSWRTTPMGFKWPEGIEERPLVQRLDSKTAYFKDGTSADIDVIVLCTGYIYAFPFLEEQLRLKSKVNLYPEGLYKGSVWLGGGNNKLFYAGVQDQYLSFTMFDVQALWICKYILGQLGEPKEMSEMKEDADNVVKRLRALKDCHEQIEFQVDFVKELCEDTGYPVLMAEAGKLYHTWTHHRKEDIVTYRDRCHASIYSGTMSLKPNCKWWKNSDDSVEAFKQY